MAISKTDQYAVNRAIKILSNELREPGPAYTRPQQVKDFLSLKLAARKNEHFCVLFLDNQHQFIEFEELFHGSISSSYVHPRVVLQRALHYNAAAVIIAHNHPSGTLAASLSDIDITKTLTTALKYIDVRVLDHIIVAQKHTLSMAETGQL